MITVREVMLDRPKRTPRDASVEVVRALLDDDHVHVALLVDPDGRLRSVVDRDDLTDAPPGDPAASYGSLEGRTVGPAADLAEVRDALAASGCRRLAVVGPDGLLLGLLALKRSGRGFCSADDVRSRAEDPSSGG